jgi:uncharacterized protein (TIGR03437 family)
MPHPTQAISLGSVFSSILKVVNAKHVHGRSVLRTAARRSAVLCFLGAMSLAAQSGFIGQTVTVNYDWPNLGDIYYAGGTSVIGATGNDFPLGPSRGINVHVNATTILITFVDGGSFGTTPSTFGGVVVTDSLASITGVSLASTNISGGFKASNISFDSRNVYIDFPGYATLPGGTTILLNVQFGGTPSIATGGVVSASAFGGFTSVAPGSLVEIYGSNLASDSRSWASSDFNGTAAPTSLDGTSATIDGQPAFINYISPTQIDIQVPSNVLSGPRPLVVSTVGGKSATYTLTVNATQPGFLAPPSFVVGAKQYVVALFSDGTYALPTGAISGLASRPAKPGDVLVFYGVGFGPVTPAISAGQIVQQSNSLLNNLQLSFGVMTATLNYQGLAPGYVGLYQFNVVVPNVAASDLVPVTFTLAGTIGTQTLYIAVAN